MIYKRFAVLKIELKSESKNSGHYVPIGDIIGQLNIIYILKRYQW